MSKKNYETSCRSQSNEKRLSPSIVLKRKKEWEKDICNKYGKTLRESKILFKIDEVLNNKK